MEARRDEIELERTGWELKKARSEQEQAEALLAESEARLRDAEARFKRASELWDERLISLEEYEEKKVSFEVSRALNRSAGARVQTAKDEVSLLVKSVDFLAEQARVAKEERRRAIETIETKIVTLDYELAESILEEEKLLQRLQVAVQIRQQKHPGAGFRIFVNRNGRSFIEQSVPDQTQRPSQLI